MKDRIKRPDYLSLVEVFAAHPDFRTEEGRWKLVDEAFRGIPRADAAIGVLDLHDPLATRPRPSSGGSSTSVAWANGTPYHWSWKPCATGLGMSGGRSSTASSACWKGTNRAARRPFLGPSQAAPGAAGPTTPASAQGIPPALAMLRDAICGTGGIPDLRGETLHEILRHSPADLDQYRLARIAEWSQPRYAIDKRFTRLTLLFDQGPQAEGPRWQAQRSFDDLRDLLATRSPTATRRTTASGVELRALDRCHGC